MASIKRTFYAILFLSLILFFYYDLSAEAKTRKEKGMEPVKNKGTVKTIKSEDGDIIDCVDIYKQPAFDNPLLKNHSIEDVILKHKLDSKKSIEMKKRPEIFQIWQKKGQCPGGTIPIRRTRNMLHFKKNSPLTNRRRRPDGSCTNEVASVITDESIYYGGHAALNIWNPQPEQLDFTTTQIWVFYSDDDEALEALEAGWHVYPDLYGDSATRLFVYWTSDNYENTGCFNLLCGGFVQSDPNFVVGGALSTSVYGGQQVTLNIDITKDQNSDNWLLTLNNNRLLGYWPTSLFNNLALDANLVQWGGEVADCNPNHHTTTPMGSGAFPSDGIGIASFMNEIEILNGTWHFEDPDNLNLDITNPACYNLEILNNGDILYGGPGNSNICP